MRFFASFVIACVIALGLFWVMFRLVNHEPVQQSKPLPPLVVDVSHFKLPERQARQKQAEAKQEPGLAPMAVAPMAIATAIESDIKIDMPPSDLHWENTEMGFEQKYWSQPGGGSGDGNGLGNYGTGEGAGGAGKGAGSAVDDYIGEMNAGKKEVVPVSTSRPNIPKLAYDNHIDGWVLLAFTVTSQGDVKNIRVMDAYPRGVFEANAIAAMRGWKYELFKGPDVQLAQRIEFEWAMYPYNMDRE